MKRKDHDLLQDMQEAIHRIQSYIFGIDYPTFLHDTKTQDAVIRNIEIIGEATKKLSQDIRTQYSDLPWKSMAGIRDRLIHDYFGINLETIWYVITRDLPNLAKNIAAIVDDLKQ